MAVTEVRRLGASELAAVAGLERRVVQADGGRLKLEWPDLQSRSGDDVEALLCWEGARLLGFAALYGGPPTIEIAGMVDPAARRRGIGTALARHALVLAHRRNAQRALLVVARTTGAGASFVASLGGVLDHSEHSLVLRSAPAGATQRAAGVRLRAASPSEADVVRDVLAAGFGSPGHDALALGPGQMLIEQDGEVVGTLRVERGPSAEGAESAGIYGFAILPRRRRRGVGGEALRQVCAELLSSGASEVHLEVEVSNVAALGLYTSLGFELRATEDYYAVPPGVAVGVADGASQLDTGQPATPAPPA